MLQNLLVMHDRLLEQNSADYEPNEHFLIALEMTGFHVNIVGGNFITIPFAIISAIKLYDVISSLHQACKNYPT